MLASGYGSLMRLDGSKWLLVGCALVLSALGCSLGQTRAAQNPLVVLWSIETQVLPTRRPFAELADRLAQLGPSLNARVRVREPTRIVLVLAAAGASTDDAVIDVRPRDNAVRVRTKVPGGSGSHLKSQVARVVSEIEKLAAEAAAPANVEPALGPEGSSTPPAPPTDSDSKNPAKGSPP